MDLLLVEFSKEIYQLTLMGYKFTALIVNIY